MVGKKVHGSTYVHRRALHLLADGERALVANATAKFPDRPWNVVRVGRASVSLLHYPRFETEAFPCLEASYRYEEGTGRMSVRLFGRTANPPILHRKELLVEPDHPKVQQWSSLTRHLLEAGAFGDLSRIGRKNAWRARLLEMGMKEARLCDD